MDIIEKLAAEGSLTAEQAERARSRAEEIIKAAREDPAFLKEATEKLAGVTDFAREVGKHMKEMVVPMTTMALLGAAVSGGSAALKAGVQAIHGKHDKKNAFDAMLTQNPELKGKHEHAELTKAFDSLYRFNPHYARDPWVAGTFVNETLGQERLDVNIVNNLVKAKKELDPSGKSALEFFMGTMPKIQTGKKLSDEHKGFIEEGEKIKRERQERKDLASKL